MKQRRPFVLLEIVLGMVLVMLALGPLFGNTIWRLKKEKALIESLQGEWRADWAFSALQEAIASHTIDRSTLPKTRGNRLTTQVEGLPIVIRCMGVRHTSDNQTVRLYEASLENRRFRFYVKEL